MSIKEKLLEIVGSGNFSDDPKVLSRYASDSSLTPAGAPSYVVKPKDAQEVSKVIQLANGDLIPVVPVSSDVHFHGATIPKQGGIVLDLARMKTVQEIDVDNRLVRIEPGVKWQQLTDELAKKGMRMIMPLLPPAGRSVLTDYLEREVPTNTVYDYGEPMQSLEIVWPTGEIFRMGSASVNGFPDSASRGANPSGPGIDFYRFVQGAQGTMGVVTWLNLKIESIPKIDKVFLAPIDDLAYAQEFLYRILPRRIGQECLLLNNVDLAAITAEKWPGDFEKMRSSPSALDPHPRCQRAPAAAGGKDRLRREVPQRGSSGTNFGRWSLRTTFPECRASAEDFCRCCGSPGPRTRPTGRIRGREASQSLFFIARPNASSCLRGHRKEDRPSVRVSR